MTTVSPAFPFKKMYPKKLSLCPLFPINGHCVHFFPLLKEMDTVTVYFGAGDIVSCSHLGEQINYVEELKMVVGCTY